ncbi:MAG: DUF4167 domain-containing protein, partial [Silicimonas sp.]|nr:DUF4167 domain-containing protein [Silicimonas sp.]
RDRERAERQEREAARQADPAEAPQPDVMDFGAPEPAPESGLVETPEKKEKPARKPRAPRKPKAAPAAEEAPKPDGDAPEAAE